MYRKQVNSDEKDFSIKNLFKISLEVTKYNLKKYNLIYKRFGESAILIEWPSKIDEQIIQDIVGFEKEIANNPAIVDSIIAYNSLTIRYQNLDDFEKSVVELKTLYKKKRNQKKEQQKLWKIPVCYDAQFGLDLERIAKEKQLSVEEIVQLHTEVNYLIYFIGFQPGFLYLGGLHKQLHTPRIATPRLRVQKGSVGIGGEQTGIYPSDSAGGWNLIGKSPIDFFDISKSKPCFAKAGDRIQFEAVTIETFHQIEIEVQKGIYQLKFQEL